MGPLEILQHGLQVLFLLIQMQVCTEAQITRHQGRPPEAAIVCFQSDFVSAFNRLAPETNGTQPQQRQNPNNTK